MGMMKGFFVFVLSGLMSLPLFAKQYSVDLGDSKVIIEVLSNGPGNNYVHVHSNETTALKAAKEVLEKQGGTLLTLIHKGGRNISFRFNKRRYTFDPNRIYTPLGIKKTLRRFSRYDKSAAGQVANFAHKIVELLPSSGLIVAVHNNRNYSMRNYYKGASMESDAKAVYKNPQQYYRNFFLVTRANDYERLKELKYNVVLQDNDNAEDDGSLSIYFADRHYINVEAGYNQLQQQIKMLELIPELK